MLVSTWLVRNNRQPIIYTPSSLDIRAPTNKLTSRDGAQKNNNNNNVRPGNCFERTRELQPAAIRTDAKLFDGSSAMIISKSVHNAELFG